MALSVLPPSSINDERRLLILGYGRVGQAVARLIGKHPTMKNMEIIATTRRSEQLLEQNDNDDDDRVKLLLYEHAHSLIVNNTCSHVLVSMPLKDPTNSIFQQIISSSPSIQWLGVISTCSVYGNHNGDWVTETSDCRVDVTQNTYLQVENLLLQKNNNEHTSVCIFRCAGIYGDTTSALHTVYKNGLPSACGNADDDALVFTNRIHVDDLAAAVVSAMDQRASGIYNLADDEPASRDTVLQYAKELLETKVGVSIIAQQQEDAKQATSNDRNSRRSKDQKRVSNERMRRDLLPILRHPTYREGLLAILQETKNPWWQ
jgi:nucleoside-diphosphate-sugar epimerase